MNPNKLTVGNTTNLSYPWVYKKWHKCWYSAKDIQGWMMLITLYDKDVKVYGNHLKWHVINPDDKGVPWHEVPEWVKEYFEDWMNEMLDEGVVILNGNA